MADPGQRGPYRPTRASRAAGAAAGSPAPAADSGPALSGLTFFNPREASDAPALTEALRAQGAAVVERPMIQFVAPATWAPFDKRLQQLSAHDWVAFTSATAVRFTLQRMRQLKLPASGLAIARLAAVGKGTAAALEGAELEVAVTPEKQQAEGLLAALKPMLQPGDRVWLPRAEEGRESLSDGLRAAGFEVTMTPVYRTIPTTDGLGPVADALYGRKLDWLIFTSPSTAVNFFKLIPEGLQDQVVRGDLQNPAPRVACLGEVTAWAVRELGFRVHVVPQQQDIPGLVEAIVTMVRGAKSSIE